MSVVAVASGTIENYAASDETLELRVYLRKSFTPSTGEALLGTRIGSQNFYQAIPCTVVDGLITYDAFDIDSTTDAMSNPNDSSYAFVLYTTTGMKRGLVYKTIKVPHTDLTTTLGDLAAYNAVDAVGVTDLYYTQDEADARYALIAAGVTNGDAHDHNGGDGAQINHVNLSNIGTLSHAQLETAIALRALDSAVVHTTGDEAVAGVKTFASSPIVPTPTTDFQAATKKYIDDFILAGNVVDSVNGQTGAVVLDTSDIDPTANRNYTSDAQQTLLGNTSGINTGDQVLTTVLSDAVYDEAAWDGVVDKAPTKNAMRDVIQVLLGLIAGGSIPDGDYGDITVSGGGTVITVDNGLAATKIGNGDVDNTELSHLNGVTSGVQGQIDGKQATLVSGSNIKTINGESLLGSTDIVVEGGGSPGMSLALAQGNFVR